ncbi:hypothetical protein ACJ41O_004976 [Fusarium nematophilum]
MAVPQYRDEVLVTLSSVDPPSDFPFPDRRFFLTKEKPTMEIGRTSKRNASYEASKNNAWFDSAVMSRKHAHFNLDVDKQKVYIKDTGSLHGTFKNGERLGRNIPFILTTGDRLRFGISIDRGKERYPPCTLEARLKFGTVDPDDRPKVFRVPDDTDVEDSGSEDDQQVRNSYEILRTMKIHPAAFPSSSPSRSPIDLTSNDQYPLSNVRDDVDHTLGAILPLNSIEKPLEGAVGLHLPLLQPEASTEDVSVSPDPGWPFSDVEEDEDEEDDDINLSQSTDMDTESSHADDSDNESIDDSRSISPYHDQDSEGLDEQDFAEHDGFSDSDCEDCQWQDYLSVIDFCSDNSGHLGGPVNEAPVEELPDADDVPSHLLETISTATSSETKALPAEAPAAGPSQLADHEKSSTQVGAVSYLLNSDLPPIEPANFFVTASTPPPQRLPSISEAMTLGRYTPSQKPDFRTTAEIMGEKTGKFEYFAARAENRANALGSYPQPAKQPLRKARVEASDHQVWPGLSVDEGEATVVDPQTSNQAEKEALEVQTDGGLRLADSALTASGVNFLNTPPEEPEVPFTDAALILDETSAYHFEVSKRAAEELKATSQEESTEPTKKSCAGFNALVESSDNAPQDAAPDVGGDAELADIALSQSAETPRSKRKAEDMSQLTPEEERFESRTARLGRRRHYRTKSKARAPEMTQPVDLVAATPPPTKRLRRVAEVVGYAALGGVAVMSALIATAPAL